MTEKQWIQFIAPAAVYCMKKYGYPASALIGQTCQETGYGKTSLVKVWNVIGMKTELLPYKSPTWSGKSVIKGTWEEVDGRRKDVDDSFRMYASAQDCLEDYCAFMRDGQISPGVYKYRHILAWKDPEAVLRFISGRYATDTTYADKVLDIIKKHNLTKYDTGELDATLGMSKKDIIKQGQKHSIEFTGHEIKVDGDRGDETRAQAFRVLRHALNLDYFGGEMDENKGDTKLLEVSIGTHYIRRGEKQYLVTAAEILLELRGVNPYGVEFPGHFGEGLEDACGKNRIEATELLEWCREK